MARCVHTLHVVAVVPPFTVTGAPSQGGGGLETYLSRSVTSVTRTVTTPITAVTFILVVTVYTVVTSVTAVTASTALLLQSLRVTACTEVGKRSWSGTLCCTAITAVTTVTRRLGKSQLVLQSGYDPSLPRKSQQSKRMCPRSSSGRAGWPGRVVDGG
jgi:hypothetical protein